MARRKDGAAAAEGEADAKDVSISLDHDGRAGRSRVPIPSTRRKRRTRRRGLSLNPLKLFRPQSLERLTRLESSGSVGSKSPSSDTPSQPRMSPRSARAHALRVTAEEADDMKQQMKRVQTTTLLQKFRTKRINMKKALYQLEMEKRNQFYKELLIYFVFLALFFGVVWRLPVHYPYEENTAFRDLFFDEEFEEPTFKKNFFDVMVASELWEWVDGPLLNGLYDQQLPSNLLVGAAQIRQVRVRQVYPGEPGVADGVACKNAYELFHAADELLTCYPEFSMEMRDQAPFTGIPDPDAWPAGVPPPVWYWNDTESSLMHSLIFTPHLLNLEMDYGHGGYLVELPAGDKEAAAAVVAQLRDGNYIDAATRAIAVSFSFYNPAFDLFTIFRVVFDFSPTGYIEKTAGVKTVQLRLVDNVVDVLSGDWPILLLFGAVVYYMAVEASHLYTKGIKEYFISFWNMLEFGHLSLLLVFVFMWANFVAISRSTWERAKECAESGCFADIQDTAWFAQALYNVAAGSSLVSLFKVFKFLRLNSRMNLMWRTLNIAVWDLMAFFAIFVMVFIGYTIMGFLAFGAQVREYRSLTTSFWACFNMLLGSFNYDQLLVAAPRLAPVFFASYMILVYITFINMFIAIMNEYYTVAQAEKKDAQRAKQQVLARRAERVAKGEYVAGSAGGSTANTSGGSPAVELIDDVEYDIFARIKAFLKKLPLRAHTVDTQLKRQLLAAADQQEKTGRVTVMEGNTIIGADPATSVSIMTSGHITLPIDAIVYLVDAEWLKLERARLRKKFRAIVRVVIITNVFVRPVLHLIALRTGVKTSEFTHRLVSELGMQRTQSALSPGVTEGVAVAMPTGAATVAGGAGPDSDAKATPDALTLANGTRRKRSESEPPPRTIRLTAEPVVPRLYIPVSSAIATASKMLSATRPGQTLVLDDGSNVNERLTLIVEPRRHLPPFAGCCGRRKESLCKCCRPKLSEAELHPSLHPASLQLAQRKRKAKWGRCRGLGCCCCGEDDEYGDMVNHVSRRLSSQAALKSRRRLSSASSVGGSSQHRPFTHGRDNVDENLPSNCSMCWIRSSIWCPRCVAARPGGDLGLPARQPGRGSGAHGRRCRVVVGGTVGGMERLSMPISSWIYFVVGSVARVALRAFERLVTCQGIRRCGRNKTLLSEEDLERLLKANAGSVDDRGRSCRFDELRREIRLIVVRRVPARRLVGMEEAMVRETADIMARFSDALTDVDPREAQGYNYVPSPVDVSKVRLPSSILGICELVAENCHEVWSKGRIDQGWKWGAARDNAKKLHPDLIPYSELTEETKQYDRDTSFGALKVILAMGWSVEKAEDAEVPEEFRNWTFGVPATEKGETYNPKPFPTHLVTLPSELKQLVELLAENTHEIWAESRLGQGWKYGPNRDDTLKRHNCLVPYMYLTEEEREFDRNTSMETLKLLVGLGYTFRRAGRANPFAAQRKLTVRAIGRSENAKLTTAADVFSVAMGVHGVARRKMAPGEAQAAVPLKKFLRGAIQRRRQRSSSGVSPTDGTGGVQQMEATDSGASLGSAGSDSSGTFASSSRRMRRKGIRATGASGSSEVKGDDSDPEEVVETISSVDDVGLLRTWPRHPHVTFRWDGSSDEAPNGSLPPPPPPRDGPLRPYDPTAGRRVPPPPYLEPDRGRRLVAEKSREDSRRQAAEQAAAANRATELRTMEETAAHARRERAAQRHSARLSAVPGLAALGSIQEHDGEEDRGVVAESRAAIKADRVRSAKEQGPDVTHAGGDAPQSASGRSPSGVPEKPTIVSVPPLRVADDISPSTAGGSLSATATIAGVSPLHQAASAGAPAKAMSATLRAATKLARDQARRQRRMQEAKDRLESSGLSDSLIKSLSVFSSVSRAATASTGVAKAAVKLSRQSRGHRSSRRHHRSAKTHDITPRRRRDRSIDADDRYDAGGAGDGNAVHKGKHQSRKAQRRGHAWERAHHTRSHRVRRGRLRSRSPSTSRSTSGSWSSESSSDSSSSSYSPRTRRRRR